MSGLEGAEGGTVREPSGTWTTYGDIAALIGTHAISVGNHVASTSGLHGPYRVLTANGGISLGFRWPDEQ
ncbi:MGMT family protein [Streptomyces sp. NBC_01186]|nr:MGMT family protein [Streptomyces sp. NBC_01186]